MGHMSVLVGGVKRSDVDALDARIDALEAAGGSSGTYTPTAASLLNASDSPPVARKAFYTRIGNIVSVSGQITIDANAGGFTRVSLTLPANAVYANQYDAAGVAVQNAGTAAQGIVVGNSSTLVEIQFQAEVAGARSFAYEFKYTAV